jgi:hypothetical protein
MQIVAAPFLLLFFLSPLSPLAFLSYSSPEIVST